MTLSAHGQVSANYTASPTNGPAPLLVFFNDFSSGSISNHFWDFGDGTTFSEDDFSVEHTYQGAGTFTVTLIVSGPAGSATNTQANLITTSLVPPVASFSASPTNGAAPLEVFFDGSTSGSITNIFWDFGDGTSTNGQDEFPDHFYQEAGTFTVTLIVSGPAGSATNTQVNLIVVPPGNSYISPSSGKWEQGVNWSLGVPPDSTQVGIYITNAASKTVTIDAVTSSNFPSTMTISNLTLSAPSGSTNTLLLSGAGLATPLDILNGLTVNSNGLLVVTNSALLVTGLAGGFFAINAGGGVVVSNGTLQNVEQAVVDGTLTIAGGTNSFSSPLSTLVNLPIRQVPCG